MRFRDRWRWPNVYDHHVVSRLIRRCGENHWLTQSAVNLGAWLDLWAERKDPKA